MSKFTKGALIAAGCFFAGGVILGIIGAVGRVYTGEPMGVEDDFGIVRDVWDRASGWDIRWRRGGAVRGLTWEYGGIEFDQDHKDSIAYGSFTDDSLQGIDIRNLDVEMGGGRLILRQGDGLKLKKENGPECQYYIEDDTFYLKQKSSVGDVRMDLTLTLPEGIMLEEIDIELAAGEVITEDELAAEEIEIDIDAGELTMENVKANSFCATVAAGSVAVRGLDAADCVAVVDMGSITLSDSLVASLDASVSMGEINVYLRDSYENHDYQVDCGMGNVTIQPESGAVKEYAGLGATMDLYGRNSDSRSLYDLSCSMGSIYVKFEGKENVTETVAAEDPGLRTDSVLPDINGIVNEWPDRIGRETENTTAEDFSFEIETERPTALVISCVTESGELDLEIEDENGKEIFEKDDIRTGEYEVKLKSSGTYRVTFDCENHIGSFWISPRE